MQIKRVVFVADHFYPEYVGGSELSLDTLICSSPYPVRKVKSIDFDAKDVQTGDFFVFGNFCQIAHHRLYQWLYPNYAVVESDYKYCFFRSPTMHKLLGSKECDCYKNGYGEFILNFFHNAKHVFWKSVQQKRYYESISKDFINSTVLSATLSDEDINLCLHLRSNIKNQKAAIIDSPLGIRSTNENIEVANKLQMPYELIKPGPRIKFLTDLSKCSILLYNPIAEDTCPRITIEAKLMGLDLKLGPNVQHKDELWFNNGIEGMVEYLKNRKNVFWDTIKNLWK